MLAHLHAHARFLKLEAFNPQRTIWSVQPTLTAEGEVAEIPTWSSPTRWSVSPDDTYRLTALYENPNSEPIDAMAVLGTYVVPETAP